jgi:hypothetical protein
MPFCNVGYLFFGEYLTTLLELMENWAMPFYLVLFPSLKKKISRCFSYVLKRAVG